MTTLTIQDTIRSSSIATAQGGATPPPGLDPTPSLPAPEVLWTDGVSSALELIAKFMQEMRKHTQQTKNALSEARYAEEKAQVSELYEKADAIRSGALVSGLMLAGSAACSFVAMESAMDAADRTEAATKQMASAERMGLGEQQVAASAAPATREAACSRAEGQFSSSLGDALNRGSGIPKDLADAAATEHDARVTGHKALSDRYADFADQQKDLAQQQSDLITKAHDAIRSIIDLRHQARMAALNARG